jgi:hypothetical protein
MFNLVELLSPFYCLSLLAGLTRLTCLSRSHMRLPYHTLSVFDVPIETVLFSISFLEIPTSTWEPVSLRQQVDVSQVLRPVRLQCMC